MTSNHILFPIFKFSAVKEIMMMGMREVVWPRMQVGRRRRGRFMFMFMLTFINFQLMVWKT